MATSAAPITAEQTTINDEALEELRMAVWGDVLTPDDPGYASVRAPYNAMYPGRPALVVLATGAADVVDAVNFAREQGLTVAVRGGGHSVAGLSSIDGGMLIDLSRMNGAGSRGCAVGGRRPRNAGIRPRHSGRHRLRHRRRRPDARRRGGLGATQVRAFLRQPPVGAARLR
jgi:hypothetical protein